MTKILIIEDEQELVRVLRSYLEKAGFEVLSAHRGDTGQTTWENTNPDLVILDLNLPGKDGIDVAREMRRKGDTPIIMLTSRSDEADRLIGLELGADDYVTKPFSPREVVARVRAVLRRASGDVQGVKMLRVGDLELDLEAYIVTRAGDPIDLTPTEFAILQALAANPGRVYSRMQLLEVTQGAAYEGYERTIDAHIKNIRAKLEPDSKNPRFIETVFGIGYRLAKT
jgi:two-component system alkaline phosphatase synthesis response regulator PhoP